MHVLRFIGEEFRAMLPPAIFFAICFNMLVLTVVLMAPGGTTSAVDHGAATLGALLTAKAVLLVDHLPFVNRYPTHPLIWNTLWKAGLYVLVTIVLRLAERLVTASLHDDGFAAGWDEVVATFDWHRALAVHLWLAILFVLYAGAREAIRAVGTGPVLAMFFGRR
jgi:hypothetical protein